MTFLEEVNHSRESSTVMPLKVGAILYQRNKQLWKKLRSHGQGENTEAIQEIYPELGYF